ncbi:MAG: hypothetical protein EXR75_04060 [Myxococcales bacterium]|nr:hypothetical protein [Myxococcales bacterium]
MQKHAHHPLVGRRKDQVLQTIAVEVSVREEPARPRCRLLRQLRFGEVGGAPTNRHRFRKLVRDCAIREAIAIEIGKHRGLALLKGRVEAPLLQGS